ncbi:MAG: hypothetical protein ACKVP0_15385 [Pirellulaceae bacterium]
MNWNRIDELYHLDSPNAENRDVLFLCHQVVHSYVFMPLLDDRQRLVGILFASDRQRHVSLLQLTINQVIDLFRQVGKDYPSQMTGKFSTEKRDFEFVSGIEPNLDVRCQGRLLTTSSKT